MEGLFDYVNNISRLTCLFSPDGRISVCSRHVCLCNAGFSSQLQNGMCSLARVTRTEPDPSLTPPHLPL